MMAHSQNATRRRNNPGNSHLQAYLHRRKNLKSRALATEEWENALSVLNFSSSAPYIQDYGTGSFPVQYINSPVHSNTWIVPVIVRR